MRTYFLKSIFTLTLLVIFIFPSFQGFASTPQEEKKILEEELRKLEEQIAKYETDITKTQQEKKTFQNQVAVLKKKIEKLNLQIQQSNVLIGDVKAQIKDTEVSIKSTAVQIGDSQEKLAAILQKIYEEDQKPLFEILITENNLSDFFENIVYLENLSESSANLLQNIKNLKLGLETQKGELDTERGDLEQILKIQILQRKETDITQSEQSKLLEKTKGKEALYQQYLKETKKRAAEIRARLFELVGVPQAPTFGEALAIAKNVEAITGVRSALLLAVLTQESNIGKNVGQCYLKDPKTGSGVTVKGTAIQNVMKPTRDVQPFLVITGELGKDPYNTPVSCPIPTVGGYGGAMGPAQFIPSTWQLYRNKLSAITGKAGDPWDIKDAFLAAALYLKDYGAASQNPNDEWKAAMIYFSGSTNSKYKFYGDSVIALANRYQQEIDLLKEINRV